ncbi:hypothetical protein [Atopobacter sp. AH10]|nr:hypothetical protein [Atopobacter sp. AH10]
MENNLMLDGPEMTPEEFYECIKRWGEDTEELPNVKSKQNED